MNAGAEPAGSTGAHPTQPVRKPRKHRRAAIAAVVAGALLLALVGSAPWWFDARRVAALVLDRAGAATGLDWSIRGEPELQWRPRPWLALPHLHVRDPALGPVFGAERVEVAVPWTTLKGESLRIEAIRLEGPELHLDAALAWWEAQPTAEDPQLPAIDGLVVTRGRIHAGQRVVDELSLRLPRFAVGEPMTLQASARIAAAAHAEAAPTAAPPGVEPVPFSLFLQLAATPREAPLRLEALSLELRGDGPVPTTRATGRVQGSPWQLRFEGSIAAWPEAWPALPAPLSTTPSPIDFSLAQEGSAPLDAPFQLHLRRDDSAIESRGDPRTLLAWWEADASAALPPLAAQATLPILEMGGVTLRGVTVTLESGREPPPAKAPTE